MPEFFKIQRIMATARIQILGLRTWGNLGNMLAARKLAAVLRGALSSVDIDVLEGEDFCPVLADFGQAIRDLKQTVSDPAKLRCDYLSLMAEAARRFPPDIEASEAPCPEEVRQLAAHFAESQPHIVIGAKGILSRLCLIALRNTSPSTPVVNYVTNHGLITIPVHRSHWFTANLVPFEETKSALVGAYGYRERNVEVVGPLLSGRGLRKMVAADSFATQPRLRKSSERTVIFLMNHGRNEYLALLEERSAVLKDVNVIFIVHRDEELLNRISALKDELRADSWRVYDSLAQIDYFDEIASAAACKHSFLVSKSGPNTVLEATSLGLPVLVHMSGLPMEDWVAEFIGKHKLGIATQDTKHLGQHLHLWVTEPQRAAECRGHIAHFVKEHFDGARTHYRLREIFNRLLSGCVPAAV